VGPPWSVESFSRIFVREGSDILFRHNFFVVGNFCPDRTSTQSIGSSTIFLNKKVTRFPRGFRTNPIIKGIAINKTANMVIGILPIISTVAAQLLKPFMEIENTHASHAMPAK
jgi:hypothetical protein